MLFPFFSYLCQRFFGKVPEWPIGAVSKTVVPSGTQGSNPCLSAYSIIFLFHIIRFLICRNELTQMSFLLFQIEREIALVFVWFTDFRHFFMGKGKAEDVDVLRHVFRIGGLRENYVAFLNVPAQNDLRIGLAVFLPQAGEKRFVQQSGIAMSQGIPAFDDRAVRSDAALQFLLLVIRMAFHLQGYRLYLRHVKHFLRCRKNPIFVSRILTRKTTPLEALELVFFSALPENNLTLSGKHIRCCRHRRR